MRNLVAGLAYGRKNASSYATVQEFDAVVSLFHAIGLRLGSIVLLAGTRYMTVDPQKQSTCFQHIHTPYTASVSLTFRAGALVRQTHMARILVHRKRLDVVSTERA